MEFLLEPLEYEFFRNALIAAFVTGISNGLIGVYVVLRGMSYVGHGLAHAAIGGAVIGAALNLNFYAGACAVGVLATLTINLITKNNKIKLDAAIGIVTTAIFAFGVAMVSTMKNFRQNFETALFGNILGINDADLMLIGVVGLITLVVMFYSYRPLLFSTFDPEAAQIFGVKQKSVQLVFSLLLTFSIIASLNVIGVTLVAATLIAPAMTARMLTDSFGAMLLYSTIIGATSNVIGMYLSYIFNVASGTTIVLFSALVFVVSMMIKPLRNH